MGEHSPIGASGAHRWMPCPGSVRMEEGIPDEDTVYSLEGTKAHEFAAVCLETGTTPGDYPGGYPLPGHQHMYVPVDQEMIDGVSVYTDFVQTNLFLEGGDHYTELRVDLAALGGIGEEMYGTADSVHHTEGLLRVSDLKYGAGVVVEAEGNPQPRYYALGAALKLGLVYQERGVWRAMPMDVEMVIVQPRAGSPPIRRERMPLRRLLKWGLEELIPAAEATRDPDAPLVPGEDQCKFCKASAGCPALQAQSLALAQQDFELSVLDRLTPDDLGSLLARADAAEVAIKAVRGYAHARALTGSLPTGYKLVEGRQNRSWRAGVEGDLLLQAELLGAEAFEALAPRKLATPAQWEKAVGRKHYPEELVEVTRSAERLVADDHPAPAIDAGPGADFAVLDEQ